MDSYTEACKDVVTEADYAFEYREHCLYCLINTTNYYYRCPSDNKGRKKALMSFTPRYLSMMSV
jgi:hypothetical protein